MANESAQRAAGLPEIGALARVHRRWGWSLFAAAVLFGVGLEALEAFRVSFVVDDAWRSRLWSLAHFHGAALGLLHLVYVPWATSLSSATACRRASVALRVGTALLPAGFLLGGLGHGEGDPSLWIALCPAGALLIVGVALAQARAAWRQQDTHNQ